MYEAPKRKSFRLDHPSAFKAIVAAFVSAIGICFAVVTWAKNEARAEASAEIQKYVPPVVQELQLQRKENAYFLVRLDRLEDRQERFAEIQDRKTELMMDALGVPKRTRPKLDGGSK